MPAARKPFRRLNLGAAPILALLVGAAAPVQAQSFLGRGAPQIMAMPETSAVDARSGAPERQTADAVAAPAATPLPQRPFPAIATSLRLSGEESSLQWPVYLTEAQARERLRLRIGYLAAISVVPDASFLTATVNGVTIGRTEIKAPGAIRIIEFDIPSDLLKPGYNAVAITGVQRHRVDCSLDATYELWTQIDPAWTGLVASPGAATATSLRDLPAIAPDSRGIVPIRVVLRSRPPFATFERLIGLVQKIAIAGRFSQVAVDFGGDASSASGLDIAFAEPDGSAGATGLGRQPLTFEPAQAGRAARITLASETPADIEAAARVVSGTTTRDPIGTPQGLRALASARGQAVRSGERLRLSDLGLTSREFTGRLFRTAFDVTLPTDFVPADYDKAVLDLAGGYAPNLEVGAQIIVDVNGRNVASVPMARAAGEIFDDETIALPLSRWRPGRNRIEIQALLPTASDRACEEGTPRRRFFLLDRSTLTMPRLALALRLPDLAATLGGGLPLVAPGRRPRLVVPAPDRDSMAAAATIAVQMALSADQPIDFELANDGEMERRAPTFVVAPARSLNPDVLRAVGLNPDQIRRIWQGRADATPPANAPRPSEVVAGASLDRLRKDLLPACALPAAGPRSTSVAPSRAQAASDSAVERDFAAEWNGVGTAKDGLADQASRIYARLTTAFRDGWASAATWATDQVEEPDVDVGAQASLVVGQGLTGRDPDSLLTVFTSPNAATLLASTTCLTAPSIWNRIEGRVATLDAADGALTVYDAKQVRFFDRGPTSFENLRLVVASWFSTNPTAFALLLFGAAISLGLSTSAMLRDVGRANRSPPNARRDEGVNREDER